MTAASGPKREAVQLGCMWNAIRRATYLVQVGFAMVRPEIPSEEGRLRVQYPVHASVSCACISAVGVGPVKPSEELRDHGVVAAVAILVNLRFGKALQISCVRLCSTTGYSELMSCC